MWGEPLRRTTLLSAGVVAAVIGALLLTASPATAVPGDDGPPPAYGIDTDITMTGVAEGQGVRGSLPIGSEVSDPGVGYPATPPAGFATANQDFAGIITAQGAESGTTLRLFCIDIRTNTYPGLGYINGSWEQAGMPNVGYVARLLNDYYPNTNEPASAPNINARAAAVQAAIWYFTDYFVLASNDPIRPYTEAIVNAIRVQPPLPFPTPPSLTVTPADDSSPAGTPAGPFTIATDAAAGAELFSTGGTMYSDAGATTPIAPGADVPDGAQVWLVPTDPLPGASVTLLARGESLVPSGNVYIYDGNTPGVTDAQRLILAETVDVVANVTATAEFVAVPVLTAALTVTKTIAGPGAGSQGAIVIDVACDSGVDETFSIPARATGSRQFVIDALPVGTVCELTEPTNGAATEALTVTTTGLGDVSIEVGGSGAAVVNTYAPALAPSGATLPLPVLAVAALLLGAGGWLIAHARRRRLS